MDSSNKTYTLVEHLAELRKRLIIIFVVNIGAAFICYQFMEVLIQYILNLNPGMEIVYLSPSELFMVYVKLAFTCAIVLCFPITVMEIWMFVAKGLLKKEKLYGMISLVSGVFFFIGGAVFCYFTVLPVTLQFFKRISLDSVDAMISIDSFVSFANTMLISFGAAFELPVVVFLLSQLEILKPATLKRMHGVLILVIFIVAAIVTPPDVVSQVLLAVPMVGLLELSIGVCWIVDKQKQKKFKLSESA